MGDEQRIEDPQVTELCERVAALFGMEAAVFLPSGTMCNEIAFRLHIRPGGDEAILHRLSHPIIAEAGGPAAFAGAMMQPLDTPKGMFTGDDVRGALRYPDRYSPRSRLVSVEQTTNMAGGRVWPLEQLRGVVEVAQRARPAPAHGRRAADERRRGLRRARRRDGRGLRHRVAGLHQGPRRAARRLPRRLGRADRGGVALQADDRRRAAPGGDRRRRGAVRARPQRRAARGGPRATPRRSRAGSPACPA